VTDLETSAPVDGIDEVDGEVAVTGGHRGLVVVLVGFIAVAVVAAAVALGYVWGNGGNSGGAPIPSLSSVDVGFARDMSVHHGQAVTMASYERDNTSDPAMKVLAYDIEGQQTFQIGEMQGWLDTWGYPLLNPSPMAWMAGHGHLGSNGLMPGMASPAEMNKLQTLHGKALDVDFLQLMIRHHQGGIPMAQYAALHGQSSYVRQLAQAMVNAQSSEIISMEQTLRSLGASPLPAPDH
jgi:uncharacterized protein (DUF305 family)